MCSLDPVDFTVVDDSTLQNTKTSSDGLPVDVNVNFEVLGSVVSLNLKRNPKVASAKDTVYVIRESKEGVPVLVSQLVKETEVKVLSVYSTSLHTAHSVWTRPVPLQNFKVLLAGKKDSLFTCNFANIYIYIYRYTVL